MKNRRGLIFLGLAVVMGLAAAWITTEFSPRSAEANIAAVKTTPVVVVRSNVTVATSLTIAQLKLVDWPIEHVPSAAFLAEQVQDVIGMYAVAPLVEGEMLIAAKIDDRPGIRWQLSPGSVLFKMTSNVGLLFPGDRVNVIFKQAL